MRKTIFAIALGLTALAAAACNNGSGTGASPATTLAPVESAPTLESPSMTIESPSTTTESPSMVVESPSAS